MPSLVLLNELDFQNLFNKNDSEKISSLIFVTSKFFQKTFINYILNFSKVSNSFIIYTSVFVKVSILTFILKTH